MDTNTLKKIWDNAVVVSGIDNERRYDGYVAIRAAFVKTFYDTESVSSREIGDIINRDHATILHYKKRIGHGYYNGNSKFLHYSKYFSGIKESIKNNEKTISPDIVSDNYERIAILEQEIRIFEENNAKRAEVLERLESEIRKANSVLNMSGIKNIDVELIKELRQTL